MSDDMDATTAIAPISARLNWRVKGEVDGYRGEWYDPYSVSGYCCDDWHGTPRDAAECLAPVMVESITHPWEHPRPGTWAETVASARASLGEDTE